MRRVAQPAEHRTFNSVVEGSKPSVPSICSTCNHPQVVAPRSHIKNHYGACSNQNPLITDSKPLVPPKPMTVDDIHKAVRAGATVEEIQKMWAQLPPEEPPMT